MSSNIRIEGVSKQFVSRSDGLPKTIIRQFTLTVRSGELVALVGPSGCGKSTVLNMVANLESPSSGHITFDRPLADIRLSVVFQQPRLLEWLSVADNIEFVLGRHSKNSVERTAIAHDLLGKVGLESQGEAFPQFLSGGQRQRVSIARAFSIQPDVLLLDEPFSALDELTARRLRQLLQSLWLERGGQRPTGILVTHNMLEAAFLADRIIVMGGSPTEIATLSRSTCRSLGTRMIQRSSMCIVE